MRGIFFHPVDVPKWALAATFAAGIGAGLCPQAVAYQNQPPAGQGDDLGIFEGRPIREIAIRKRVAGPEGDIFESLSPTEDQLLRNQLRSMMGRPFRAQTIADDLGNINRLGRFTSVIAEVDPREDGSVRLIFTVTPQAMIDEVSFTGNRRIDDTEIDKLTGSLADSPADPQRIELIARGIKEMYKTRGYYLADVTWDQDLLLQTGSLVLIIREGHRVRVTDIRFDGNESFPARDLKREIHTTIAGLLSKGPLDWDVLSDDVASIMKFYRDRGYLDIRADRGVRPSPDGREAIVTFLIEEGSLYTLRNIGVRFVDDAGDLQDRGVFTKEQVAGIMQIKSGDVYSVDRLRRSVDDVRTALLKLGFVDVLVGRVDLRDENLPLVDLSLTIRPGERYRTGEIIVRGNELTRKDVVLRQSQAKPDRYLDVSDVEDTERRLKNTQLFDHSSIKATIQQPDPEEPEHRDILLEVQETNTGSVGFGAQINSDAGLIGQFTVEQRNFDITDWPSSTRELFSGRAFRGGGQTAKLEVLPGTNVEVYSASLSEPYLLGSDYSGSAVGFFRKRDFSDHSEEKFGTRLGSGRRFGSLWDGGLNLRLESVNLFELDTDAPVDLFRVEDQHVISGLSLRFNRSTFDNPLHPSSGNRLSFNIEQIGVFGGDFDFTKLGADYSVHIPLREDFIGRRTILSFKTSADYIPQDSDDVPIYERFHLGGQSFRGFDFRGVSPRGIRNDTGTTGDDPVGGTWAFFLGVELEQPIYEEVISIVGFLDSGTVTQEIGFDDYRLSAGVGLRLNVPQITRGAPLAFDFGFPLSKQSTDDTRLFTFSVDLPF